MNESTIERTVTLHAKRRGWISVKLSGAYERMFLRDGVAVYLAFGSPNDSQRRTITSLRAAGFSATWVDNFEDGKRFFANR